MKRLGFNPGSPNVLMEALRLHASHGDAIMDGSDVYGDHFVLVGKLVGPAAERLIESVCVRRTGETAIRFVTLKPVRKST